MREGLPPGPGSPAPIQTWGLLVKPIEFFERNSERFGETFTARILRGGTLVFISDPESLKRLFGADRGNTLPPGRSFALRPLLGERSLLLLEGDQHLRRRKLMLPPFHGERMRAYEQVMREATETEMRRWPVGTEFRLHPAMQAITMEVILTAVFGVTDPARRRELSESLVAILATTGSPRAIGLALSWPRRIGLYRRTVATMARADELIHKEIAERRADPEIERRDDILSMLAAATDEDGEAMDADELRDQLMTLLLAGHETTATSLAWAFDLLFRNPASMNRLREELAGGGGEYLDAVVAETLRLRPVVPFVGRTLTEPMELGGWRLPAGTNAMPAIWLTHTRPDIYEHPREFRPERFLDRRPDTFGWIPFGGGTRRCLGGAFAEFEMKVVLRTVLEHAELRPATSEPEPIVRRNVTLAPKHGTRAVLAARK